MSCWLLSNWLHELLKFCWTCWNEFRVNMRHILFNLAIVTSINEFLVIINSSINYIICIFRRWCSSACCYWGFCSWLLTRIVIVAWWSERRSHLIVVEVNFTKCICNWSLLLITLILWRAMELFVLSCSTWIQFRHLFGFTFLNLIFTLVGINQTLSILSGYLIL